MEERSADSERQIIDREHLRLLAMFYYIVGGVYLFFSSFLLIYVAFGIMIATSPAWLPAPPKHGGPPAIIGYFIAGLGGLGLLFGWTIGGLTIYTGRSIHQRRRRVLTYVMAAINCLWMPFGTVLGVLTFIVLSRRSVSALYDAAAANGVAGSLREP